MSTLAETVLSVIERESGDIVTEATPLESLNLDSLEFIDLLLVLGNEVGKEIGEGELSKLVTVGDIVKALS